MCIEMLFFDLDDTLWACEPLILRAEEKHYQWLVENYPQVLKKYDFDSLLSDRVSYFQEQDDRHNLTALRKSWLQVLAESLNIQEKKDFIKDSFDVFWLARNEIELFPEVIESLVEFQKEYKLGVITNGNADVYHIGIGDFFDVVVSSEEAGYAKPDSQIFEYALEKADVAAPTSVYIGDHPKADILGAKSVGMKAVWVNPKMIPWPGGETPDGVIRNLSELKEIISKL